jgi:PHP family Zn ribbon phosphoesterase
MLKERLHTGLYECNRCDGRYEIEDAHGDDLICECGGQLELEDSAEIPE